MKRDPHPTTRPPAVLVLLASAGAVLALLPLVYIAVRATENGFSAIRDEIVSARTLRQALRSLMLGATVTLACAVIGTTCAWVIARSNLRGRRVVGVVLAAPLAVPTYVAAYTWIASTSVSGFRGSVLVLTACCYPYVYLPVLAAFAGIDSRQEEVARSLGLSPASAFRRVTLPLIRPSLTSGCLLVALYVLSDFGAVSLMRHDVFTTAIFQSYRSGFDRTPAAILACLLALITLVIVGAEARARREVLIRQSQGAARPAQPVSLGRWAPPAWMFVVAIVATALGAPFATLARWALHSPNDPVTWRELGGSIWSTVRIALGGALLTTVIALPIGVLAARYRTRAARAVESASYLGHALPGLVIALSLVFFGVRFATPIYQRTPLLLVAYAILFLPAGVAAIRTSVAQAPLALDDVARSLGSRPRAVLGRVLLPIAAPGIGAGAALLLLTCVKELPATLLLRPTGFDTLATRLWTETSIADYGRAAPYALAIIVVASIPMFALTSASTRRSPA